MAHYLRKKDDPFAHIATPALMKRNDMYSCDINGNFASATPIGGFKPSEIEELAPTITMPSTMDKDQLETYALEKFGVDLDKRRSISILRIQVEGMIDGTLSKEDVLAGRIEPPEAPPEEEEEDEEVVVVEEKKKEEKPADEFSVKAVIPEVPEDMTTIVKMKKFAKEHKLALTTKVGEKREVVKARLVDLVAEANKE